MSSKRTTTEILIYCVLSAISFFLVADRDVKADFVFGEPENLGPIINSSLHDAGARISSDALSLWFSRHVVWNENNTWWLATRATTDAPWDAPMNHGEWNDSLWNLVGIRSGLTTADGLELYFNGDLPGGYGRSDLWVKKRDTIEANWGPPVNLGPVVNSPYDEIWPVLSPDELELYFSGFGSTNARLGGQGGADLWVTRRVSRNDPWGEPLNLGPTINSPQPDSRPSMSADGLLLFFDSQRSGGAGSADLYMARRATLAHPWEAPVNLGPFVNSPAFEECAQLSVDGTTLYWDSARAGGYGGHDIWQVPVLLIVDFNGDRKVDAKDLLCMVGNWGTTDPLCDIGPFAWGDGTVGLEDLTVLADYIGEEVTDPTLTAHWALDDTEGLYAHDSAGENDAVVMSEPVWQPTGGQVNGAILLGGSDDCIVAGLVLNPAAGPFSVLAWVKGGAAGQVVLSEPTAANWLVVDTEGKLMTELQGPGRDGRPLQSQIIISDGQWHRIGLVWDGSHRSLYVDGVVAAEDTQSALPNSGNGLYIGTGKGMEPGTFWSGLIDDVRIYTRAVRP